MDRFSFAIGLNGPWILCKGDSSVTFLKCPFNCGRMYTSQSKLRKHVTATHNLVVQADPDDSSTSSSPSVLITDPPVTPASNLVPSTSGIKPVPEVPIMKGPGSLVQTKTLFKTDDGRIMCPIVDCTNTFPHYARYIFHLSLAETIQVSDWLV